MPQSSETPDWQLAAGGKMSFEVASVKPIPYESRHSPTFPLDTWNAFVPGGRFSAAYPLSVYIQFAYKLAPYEGRIALAHLPAWVNDWNNGLVGIEARAAGNPSKDQMRLMMQSLLAERCKLAVHFETREVPVLALMLVKPGHPGPKLRPHSEGPPCSDYSEPTGSSAPLGKSAAFPPNCDTVMLQLNGAEERMGSRNSSMALIAAAIAGSHDVDQLVVDRTGLSGTFDFTLEYTADNPSAPPNAPTPDFQGTPFLSGMREQLGLKLVPSKAPVRMLVVDHVERPSVN